MRFNEANRAKYDNLVRNRDRAHEALRAATARREESMDTVRDAELQLSLFKSQYRNPEGAELARREKSVAKAKAEYARLTAEERDFSAKWNGAARLVERCTEYLTKHGVRLNEGF